MPKESSNVIHIQVDPGLANEQENFALNGTPPDKDTKGCIPDAGDGYKGQALDFNAVGSYRYPEFPADTVDSHGLPMPLA